MKKLILSIALSAFALSLVAAEGDAAKEKAACPKGKDPATCPMSKDKGCASEKAKDGGCCPKEKAEPAKK